MAEERKEQVIEVEEEDGINLLDYLIVLAKHKKLILEITLLVAVITLALTFIKYTFYEAMTSILPPQPQNVSIASRLMTEFGIVPANNSNVLNKQELIVEIIKSRTFVDKIIDRFNLKEQYDAESMKEAREAFFENLRIEPDFTDKKAFAAFRRQNSPLIRIYVRDPSAEKAAEIANAIVDELKIFINNIAITEASVRRLFFEQKLKEAKESLIKAENDVKEFQQTTGMLKVDVQTDAMIEKIADIEAQITAKEVELQVMRSYSTPINPDVKRVEETIKALKQELTKLEADENSGKNLLIPVGTIPEVGLDYKRKYRELKFHETLYEILVKQYELARIDEAKDAAIIQVIDKAVPPVPEEILKERLLSRKKALAITTLAFFFACFIAFFREWYLREGVHSERLAILKSYLSFRRASSG
jgi:uncharacterized protein involved in exopolysaccharide biosynthesis